MRGRYDRGSVLGDVDAQFGQRARMLGKCSRRKLPGFVADVQKDAVEAVLLHLEIDGAGHDVAGREFFPAVVLGMKRLPSGRRSRLPRRLRRSGRTGLLAVEQVG